MHTEPKLVVEHATGQYPIFIEDAWFSRIAEAVAGGWSPLVVITDETVEALYAKEFCANLGRQTAQATLLTIAPGESSKSISVVDDLYQQLLSNGANRNATIVALGGGVVGDVAGFVAATWMRGIRLVQIPTTLLAQVDSSVGGKTGVNLPGAKNLVGAFWQPEAVFIDTALLKTLTDAEYTSGLAEVVKYGVILDESLFELLEQQVAAINLRDTAVLVEIVQRCCQLKAQVVKQDERETTGYRAILNYGHTFGHAIESVSGFGNCPHGHAVAMGMTAAANLGELLGMVDGDFVQRQSGLLTDLNIPVRFPAEQQDTMLEVMKNDKKATDGQPRFVLPRGMGQVELTEHIDPQLVAMAMQRSAGAGH